jgi:hypothetical protein
MAGFQSSPFIFPCSNEEIIEMIVIFLLPSGLFKLTSKPVFWH